MTAHAYWSAIWAGALIGAVYGLFRLRAPAPPLIALIGLLGMLSGFTLYGNLT